MPETTKTKKDEKFDFKKAIEDLEEINRWFQSADIDLDEGLEKLKKGKELISKCQKRLTEAENEFVKIRDDLGGAEEATEIKTDEPLDENLFDFEK
jgi:exodeoxyribonuclease VII small subunit